MKNFKNKCIAVLAIFMMLTSMFYGFNISPFNTASYAVDPAARNIRSITLNGQDIENANLLSSYPSVQTIGTELKLYTTREFANSLDPINTHIKITPYDDKAEVIDLRSNIDTSPSSHSGKINFTVRDKNYPLFFTEYTLTLFYHDDKVGLKGIELPGYVNMPTGAIPAKINHEPLNVDKTIYFSNEIYDLLQSYENRNGELSEFSEFTGKIKNMYPAIYGTKTTIEFNKNNHTFAIVNTTSDPSVQPIKYTFKYDTVKFDLSEINLHPTENIYLNDSELAEINKNGTLNISVSDKLFDYLTTIPNNDISAKVLDDSDAKIAFPTPRINDLTTQNARYAITVLPKVTPPADYLQSKKYILNLQKVENDNLDSISITTGKSTTDKIVVNPSELQYLSYNPFANKSVAFKDLELSYDQYTALREIANVSKTLDGATDYHYINLDNPLLKSSNNKVLTDIISTTCNVYGFEQQIKFSDNDTFVLINKAVPSTSHDAKAAGYNFKYRVPHQDTSLKSVNVHNPDKFDLTEDITFAELDKSVFDQASTTHPNDFIIYLPEKIKKAIKTADAYEKSKYISVKANSANATSYKEVPSTNFLVNNSFNITINAPKNVSNPTHSTTYNFKFKSMPDYLLLDDITIYGMPLSGFDSTQPLYELYYADGYLDDIQNTLHYTKHDNSSIVTKKYMTGTDLNHNYLQLIVSNSTKSKSHRGRIYHPTNMYLIKFIKQPVSTEISSIQINNTTSYNLDSLTLISKPSDAKHPVYRLTETQVTNLSATPKLLATPVQITKSNTAKEYKVIVGDTTNKKVYYFVYEPPTPIRKNIDVINRNITMDSIYKYTGTAIEPSIKYVDTTVTPHKTLVEGTDYTLTYSNNINVTDTLNPAKIIMKGLGDYEGTIAFDFKITKATPAVSFVQSEKTVNATNLPIDTNDIKSLVHVQLLNSEVYDNLVGHDYSYSYKKVNETNYMDGLPNAIGKYDIKVTTKAVDNYTSASTTAPLKLTITPEPPKDITNTNLSITQSQKTYNGKPIEPKITIIDNSSTPHKTLTKGVDYKVTYSNNIKATTPSSPAKLMIYGIGKYTGSRTLTFNIENATPTLSFTQAQKTENIGDLPLDASDIKPLVKVQLVNSEIYDNLTGHHYSYSYRKVGDTNYINGLPNGVGQYDIKVSTKAVENYHSATTATPLQLTINPAPATKISSSDIKISYHNHYVYTGKNITQDVKITDESVTPAKQLILGTDYSLVYPNDPNATVPNKPAEIIVTGINNYTGNKTLQFNIAKATPVVSFTQPEKLVNASDLPLNVNSLKALVSVQLVNSEDYDTQNGSGYIYSYKAKGTNTFINGLPTTVGEYDINVMTKETANYDSASSTTALKLTIKPVKPIQPQNSTGTPNNTGSTVPSGTERNKHDDSSSASSSTVPVVNPVKATNPPAGEKKLVDYSEVKKDATIIAAKQEDDVANAAYKKTLAQQSTTVINQLITNKSQGIIKDNPETNKYVETVIEKHIDEVANLHPSYNLLESKDKDILIIDIDKTQLNNDIKQSTDEINKIKSTAETFYGDDNIRDFKTDMVLDASKDLDKKKLDDFTISVPIDKSSANLMKTKKVDSFGVNLDIAKINVSPDDLRPKSKKNRSINMDFKRNPKNVPTNGFKNGYAVEVNITEGADEQHTLSKLGKLTFNLDYFDFGTTVSDKNLSIFRLNEKTGVWEPVGGKYDPETNTISTRRITLSQYTVMQSNKSFNDIDESWAKDEINALLNKGVVEDSTSFKPTDNITRKEFAAWLTKTYGLEKENSKMNFSDVSKDDKYYRQLASGYEAGLFSGKKDNQFDPDGTITRQEMAVLLTNALTTYDDKKINANLQAKLNTFGDVNETDDWAKDALAFAVELDLLPSDNGLDPNGVITKEMAANILNKIS